MKMLAVSALLVACHSSSTSAEDVGAPSLVVIDAHARCPRVEIIRGADVCLVPTHASCVVVAELERHLRSTNVVVCAREGESLHATMNISATGTLVNVGADRLDTGILSACLREQLGASGWPSNRDDYSITIDVGGDCS
jgi:hypothetical protein